MTTPIRSAASECLNGQVATSPYASVTTHFLDLPEGAWLHGGLPGGEEGWLRWLAELPAHTVAEWQLRYEPGNGAVWTLAVQRAGEVPDPNRSAASAGGASVGP